MSSEEIDSLRDGSRPPIPDDTLIKVLHDAKRTCCICRDPTRAIIIHHIVEWSKSHDHSEVNLAVLCLEHHDAAHTRKALSLSLSAAQVRQHKSAWLDQVRNADAKAVIGLARIEGARWDFINHQRLFELVTKLGIDATKHPFYAELRAYGFVHSSGYLIPYNRWPTRPRFWIYDVGEGMYLYAYTSSLLEQVISSLPIVDLTNRWSKPEVLALVKPNSWVSLQSAFYFKNLVKHSRGRNQSRRATRRRAGIQLEFGFDAWDATSSTSKVIHLSGYRTALSVLITKSINLDDQGGIRLTASCLAVGSNFEESRLVISKRPPPSELHKWDSFDSPEEDE